MRGRSLFSPKIDTFAATSYVCVFREQAPSPPPPQKLVDKMVTTLLDILSNRHPKEELNVHEINIDVFRNAYDRLFGLENDLLIEGREFFYGYLVDEAILQYSVDRTVACDRALLRMRRTASLQHT